MLTFFKKSGVTITIALIAAYFSTTAALSYVNLFLVFSWKMLIAIGYAPGITLALFIPGHAPKLPMVLLTFLAYCAMAKALKHFLQK